MIPDIEVNDLTIRKLALDAALSLNRSYIGNKSDWPFEGLLSASDVVDDAELFYNFLKG